MNNIYDSLLTYYQSNPLVEIDDANLPAYIALVEKVLNDTLLEYSKYDPIYEVKEITPVNDKIDIYTDISPLVIDIVYFGEKEYATSDLYRFYQMHGYNFSRFKYSSALRNVSSSLLDLISNYESYQLLKSYFSITIERIIVGGRYITGLKPNVVYITAYTRFRTKDEIYLSNKTIFEKLFVLNLVDNMANNSKFMGDSVLKSISISGLSVSFGFPSIDETRKYIQEQKKMLLNNLMSTEDSYLPEIF